MSERKTIQINPDLFKVSKQTRKKKDPSNGDGSGAIPKLRVKSQHDGAATHKHSKTSKSQILKYIRQQQQNKYDEMLKHGAKKHDAQHVREDLIDDFETDFKQSLNFLNNMAEKTATTVPKTWNSTLKNTGSLMITQPSVLQHALHHPSASMPVPAPASVPTLTHMPVPTQYVLDENVQTIVPDVFSQPQRVLLPPAPQYGCLKNGRLPTYRSWNTAKNLASLNQNVQGNIQPVETQPMSVPMPVSVHVPPPQKTLEERLNDPVWLRTPIAHPKTVVNTKHAIERRLKEIQSQNQNKPKRHQRKTMRRTFVLGKSKHYPKIGVLVSNKTLRKQIGTHGQKLKQTPIDEVRKTLIKKGLIKVGSIAPNDVLRKMYETMNMMCGDLQNHNPDNLIYNYLNGE